jgi:arabinan endo-1,5-alpha-L-arabinosidase
MTRTTALAAVAAVVVFGGGCGSGHSAATYRNPVFHHDAPDPSIIRAPDGSYYAYTTQSIYFDLVNIPVLHSTDLVHWRKVADAFPHYPNWVLGGPAGDMWAPHATRLGGRYLLYYAGRRASVGDMAIGVGVSPSPAGPFQDLGHPLLTRDPGQPPYTAIDPFVMRTPAGHVYLYYGSDNQPIRVVELSADGLSVTGNPRPIVYPVAGNGPYTGLVEGAWVLPHAGWYYLMYSVGDCCSEHANYSVFVSRSRSPLGPFTPDPHNPILMANRHFWAVGHNSTIADASGVDWIVYHARVRGEVTDDRDLMLDRINWSGDWPVVNGGHGPSTSADAPAVH